MKKIVVYILFFTIMLVSCGKNETSKEADSVQSKQSLLKDSLDGQETSTGSIVEISEQKFNNSGIELGTLQERNLKDIVKCNGILTLPPQNKANISSLIAGTVKEIFVIEGDLVKKGKVLATLLSPEAIKLQEDYLNATDNFKYFEKEYARQKELLNENVTSGKKFQETEAAYNSEKGRLRSLAAQLVSIGLSPEEAASGNTESFIPVRAPIDGYVRKIDINIGTFVAATKEMFEIVDLHHLHIDLQAFEKDFAKIQIGQKVNVVLPHQENSNIEAEVFATGKAFENDSRSVTIHAEIKNNKNKSLIPGMYVNAFIETGTHKVPAVPEEAVISDGGKQYIFILKDKRKEGETIMLNFKPIEVAKGITEEGFTEVKLLEPILDNAQIVIKGAYYLSSEMKKEQEGKD
jgi:cobalt-zinc-cadmium efflux system membrane fusion protein